MYYSRYRTALMLYTELHPYKIFSDTAFPVLQNLNGFGLPASRKLNKLLIDRLSTRL